MRFRMCGFILVTSLLVTACERGEEKAISPEEAGRPPRVGIAAPVVSEPTIPENLSEPAKQTGEPANANANANVADKKKPKKLIYTIPAEWTKIPPCAGVAERRVVKHVAEDKEDAMLDVERPIKTPAGASTVVERWREAFSGPGGAALPDGAFRSETLDVGGLAVTLAEIRGYHRVPGPAPARPGIQLLGAIVDTPTGLWSFKLLGPEATVNQNREAFLELVRGAHLE